MSMDNLCETFHLCKLAVSCTYITGYTLCLFHLFYMHSMWTSFLNITIILLFLCTFENNFSVETRLKLHKNITSLAQYTTFNNHGNLTPGFNEDMLFYDIFLPN